MWKGPGQGQGWTLVLLRRRQAWRAVERQALGGSPLPTLQAQLDLTLADTKQTPGVSREEGCEPPPLRVLTLGPGPGKPREGGWEDGRSEGQGHLILNG